jgi:hypothetical protein
MMHRFTVEQALPYIQETKTFTTRQLFSRFRVGKMQAAGVIATMRGRGELRPAQPSKQGGSSCWRYTG